jgi:hypothetical protein
MEEDQEIVMPSEAQEEEKDVNAEEVELREEEPLQE